MARPTTTTTFRFPTELHELLARMAGMLKTSRTEVLEKSTLLTAGLLNEASKSAHDDLFELRARYGNDARLVMGAFENDDGSPGARLMINGEEPKDVRALAWVDKAGGEAHMFLEVDRSYSSNPQYVKIGVEAIFVPFARMPVGVLPWPPKPNLAIQILLADIEQAAKEAEPALDLIET